MDWACFGAGWGKKRLNQAAAEESKDPIVCQEAEDEILWPLQRGNDPKHTSNFTIGNP